MDVIRRRILSLPPFTRYWTGGTIVCTLLIAQGVVRPVDLEFAPNKIASQPWRLVTSFCFVPRMGFWNILAFMFHITALLSLENSYNVNPLSIPRAVSAGMSPLQVRYLRNNIGNNGLLNYTYFIAQICVSLLVLLLWTRTFGLSFNLCVFLTNVLSYLWCRTNRDVHLHLGIVTIRAAYYPLAQAVYDFMLYYAYNHFNIIREFSFLAYLSVLVRSPLFWSLVLKFSIPHTWWVVRYLLVQTLHRDANKRREQLQKAGYSVLTDWVREVVLIFLLPPWYWVIAAKVRRMHNLDEAEEVIDEDDGNGDNEEDVQNRGDVVVNGENEVLDGNIEDEGISPTGHPETEQEAELEENQTEVSQDLDEPESSTGDPMINI